MLSNDKFSKLFSVFSDSLSRHNYSYSINSMYSSYSINMSERFVLKHKYYYDTILLNILVIASVTFLLL